MRCVLGGAPVGHEVGDKRVITCSRNETTGNTVGGVMAGGEATAGDGLRAMHGKDTDCGSGDDREA